jgi:hypothetical protein
MFFALTDCVQYVFKLGRYSATSLTRIGAIHASPEMYDAVVSAVAADDFFFVHPLSALCLFNHA